MNEAQDKKSSVFASGGTDEEKKKRFQAGGMISMGAMLAGGIFQIAWMSYTQRSLGAEGYGIFGPFFFLFYALTAVIGLGLPQTLTTFISNHYENELEESVKFIEDGMRLLCMISIGAAALAAVVFFAIGKLGYMPMDLAGTYIALFAAVTMMILFWGASGILGGFQRMDLVAIGNLIFPTGTFVFTVIFVLIGKHFNSNGSHWEIAGAVLALGVGQFSAFIPSMYLIQRTGIVDVRNIFSFSGSHGLYAKILKFGGITAAALICNTLIQQATTIIVKMIGMHWLLFGPTEQICNKALGHYSAAMTYGLATMLISGLGIAILPAMSEAESQGKHELVQHYFDSAMNTSFTILTAFVIAFAIFIGNIGQMMGGPDYPAEVMHPLGVLGVFGGAGAALLLILVNIFIGLKKPVIPAVTTFIVFGGLIASTAAFSFIFRDIRWAMAGFILSTWTGDIILFATAKKYFNITLPAWTYLEPVLSGAVPCLFVLFILSPMLGEKSISDFTPVNAAIKAVCLLGPFIGAMIVLNKRRKKLFPENEV